MRGSEVKKPWESSPNDAGCQRKRAAASRSGKTAAPESIVAIEFQPLRFAPDGLFGRFHDMGGVQAIQIQQFESRAGLAEGVVINPTKVTLDLGENAPYPPYDGFFNAMPAYIGYQDVAGIKWVGGILGERKKAGLPQEEFAIRSGLGLRFVRELEHGKETVRLDKVNQALAMFGKEAVPGEREERNYGKYRTVTCTRYDKRQSDAASDAVFTAAVFRQSAAAVL